jgi:sugar lactone lactonase YvrE
MELRVWSEDLRQVVPEGAAWERLATGFQFTEGPLWDPRTESVLFSDIPGDTLHRWSARDGVSIFRRPSGKANGNTWDRQGRLLTCEHARRRLSRTEHDGQVVALAERYDGKRLNSPNDVVVRSDGLIYFTDPPYGLLEPFGVTGEAELPFHGVFCLAPDAGVLTLLLDDFDRPNGLAFSPDERFLYVADTPRHHLRVFEVRPDGTLAGGRLFAETNPAEGEGRPDGVKVDVDGRVYVAGPGGIWVFDPSGAALGLLRTPERAANLNWGGRDRQSLYVTATSSLYRTRLNVAGSGNRDQVE